MAWDFETDPEFQIILQVVNEEQQQAQAVVVT